MKLRFKNQRRHALTILEVMVIVAVLFMLVMILLPILAAAKRRASQINCISNVKQVSLSFRIWEGDNNNRYPMAVSVTNGGAMELIAAGNVAGLFHTMSNELSVPKILICPKDMEHAYATNFENDFNNSHISYFVSPDVTNESNPNMILTGDDNLNMGGSPVGPGVLKFSTNAPITWMATRHISFGNIAFADGSVGQFSNVELQLLFPKIGMATNRFAIP